MQTSQLWFFRVRKLFFDFDLNMMLKIASISAAFPHFQKMKQKCFTACQPSHSSNTMVGTFYFYPGQGPNLLLRDVCASHPALLCFLSSFSCSFQSIGFCNQEQFMVLFKKVLFFLSKIIHFQQKQSSFLSQFGLFFVVKRKFPQILSSSANLRRKKAAFLQTYSIIELFYF